MRAIDRNKSQLSGQLFKNMKIVNKCFSEDQFLESCKNLYSQIGDSEVSQKLKKASEFFVQPRSQTYGSQLLDLVDELLQKKIK